MNPSSSKHQLVFVYGTLKRGFHNHWLMRQICAEFVSEARTADAFPLVVRGLPYLLDLPGEGYRVEGEIYRVSEPGFQLLDRLERHPDWYRRRLLQLKPTTVIFMRLGRISCWSQPMSWQTFPP